tara:strand:+ start:251 stop:475 length:225 start_codon:yes stop_codon:yes gene_type:complete
VGDRILSGAAVALMILTRPSSIGRSHAAGFAVALADVSTPDTLREALRAADAIDLSGFAGGGVILEPLAARLWR